MKEKKQKENEQTGAMNLLMLRMNLKKAQLPQRMHYRLQYFVFDKNATDVCTYIAYASAGKQELCFKDMQFATVDGFGEVPELVKKRIANLAVRPLGGSLISIRRSALQEGGGVFRFSSRNKIEPLYYYTLDAEGKALFAPKKLRTGTKVLFADRCYMLTDSERSFALYFHASENELWKMPVV